MTTLPAFATTWSQRLQRRVMRRLLLHDQRLFGGQFRLFHANSTLPALPLLQQYDRYMRLLTLSDELLDDIMPRIRRQLSLQANQAYLREEAPTRGVIDWQRTNERSWRETPGLAPLQFDTHLRQRSTATVPNIFAVAVVLMFRQTLRAALQEPFEDEALSTQEYLLLTGADERAERELAASYARALVEQARHADVDTLAVEVAKQLRPGASPYRDLLAWWQRFNTLRIGRAGNERSVALATKRDDDKTDAWLYELWIALEVVHLLNETDAVIPHDTAVAPDLLQFSFAWNSRRFRFTYNRQWTEEGSTNSASLSAWLNAPASRPDYVIEREQPLEVRHRNTLIWREPPVVMDAKYYLAGTDPARTHAPIKKLLGDTVLLNARHCMLFFPLLPDPPASDASTRVVQQDGQRHHAGMPSELQVRLYKLTPDMALEQLHTCLRTILDHACASLPERPSVRCHGVWLDADTLSAGGKLLSPPILCPKPHIGPRVVDLVDPDTDCLRNARVCHVIGQPIVPPIIVRVATQDELTQRTGQIRAQKHAALNDAEQHGDQEHAEQLRQQIFTGVGRTVEHYVKLHGNTASIEETLEHWIFGAYWKSDPRSLSEDTRNMLLSAEYVWQECREAQLVDWAAPAIQYCRALEHELRRRLFDHCPSAYKLTRSGWTLGTPLHAYTKRPANNEAQYNWAIFEQLVRQARSDLSAFEQVFQRLVDEDVGKLRNRLAHGTAIAQTVAHTMRTVVLGSRMQVGVLPWITEHLPPA